MAAAAVVSNGNHAAVQTPSTGRFAAGYSEVQNSLLDHSLPLPSVPKSSLKVVDGPPRIQMRLRNCFLCLFGQPSVNLVPGDAAGELAPKALKIGVVLSGGQAPGGHKVISGIFDFLQDSCTWSTLYGFRGGPAGIMKGKYGVLTPEYIYPYRNQGGFDMICSGRDKIETPEQFEQAADTAVKLDLVVTSPWSGFAIDARLKFNCENSLSSSWFSQVPPLPAPDAVASAAVVTPFLSGLAMVFYP